MTARIMLMAIKLHVAASLTFAASLWLQLMVCDCMALVHDDVLRVHHHHHDDGLSRAGIEDADDGRDDGGQASSRCLFIAAVARCCALLHQPSLSLRQLSSLSLQSAAAAAAAAAAPAPAVKPRLAIHDSVASASNRLFHRMVAMFSVQRCCCCCCCCSCCCSCSCCCCCSCSCSFCSGGCRLHACVKHVTHVHGGDETITDTCRLQKSFD
jgi:hypothetical protein